MRCNFESGFSPSQLLSYVVYLAGRIGPRGTGTDAEARAVQYVRDQLGALGCSFEKQRFRAVADMNWFPASAAIFILLGALMRRFNSQVQPSRVSKF